MRPRVAERRIASFKNRFGEPHLYLAYHAAFPLALTPALLYQLWANFRTDINKHELNIPWVAVADLMLSGLCEKVGYELYEMNKAVRTLLLKQLEENENFGQTRIIELSNYLLDYVKEQLESEDPDVRDFAEAQHWTALAYVKRTQAARELALKYHQLYDRLDLDASEPVERDRTELIRMASLVETLVEPLSNAKLEPLLVYARSMASFADGDSEKAKAQLSDFLNRGQKLQVDGVTLPIPEPIQIYRKPDHRRLNPIRLLRDSFTSVGSFYIPLLLFQILYLIPVLLIRFVNSLAEILAWSIIAACIVIWLWLLGAEYFYTYKKLNFKRVNIFYSLQKAGKRIFHLLFSNLIFFLGFVISGVILGFAIVLVTSFFKSSLIGIVISIMLFFLWFLLLIYCVTNLVFISQVIVIENRSAIGAIKRSWDLVTGRWWVVFWAYFVLGSVSLIFFLPSLLIPIYVPAGSNTLIIELLGIIPMIAITPLLTVYSVLLYMRIQSFEVKSKSSERTHPL